MKKLRKLMLSGLLAVTVLVSITPAFAHDEAADGDDQQPVSLTRKVNEYEGQHLLTRKVNEYEGQH